MKLNFKNQDFQTDAVNSVVDLFAGMAKGVNIDAFKKAENIINQAQDNADKRCRRRLDGGEP